MNREVSLYLDLIRLAAALVVFFGHVSSQRLTGGFLWQFGGFADDAVVVFFVLSGFVIAHVVANREMTALRYGIARGARMYSVAIPALIGTFVLDYFGSRLAPALYTASWGYNGENQIAQYLAGVFFIHGLWFTGIGIGSMLPYWSLGYEVWYYVLFGIACFASPRRRTVLLVVGLLVVGPRIAALFPLWLCGCATYHAISRMRLRPAYGWMLWIGSVVAYCVYRKYVGDAHLTHDLVERYLGDNLVKRYVVGALFCVHLLGLANVSLAYAGRWPRIDRPLRWLAGATFTIYLFHLPVAQFLAAVNPWASTAWRSRILVMAGTLALMFVIAEFTERRKDAWAAALRTALERLGVPRREASA